MTETEMMAAGVQLPPHSLEAEQSVLGGLMLSNDAWDRIGDVLSEADFYRQDHATIYRHICKLIEANKPADVLTVSESLRGADNAPDLLYVHALAERTPSAANIRRYAEIVRDKALLRKTIAATAEISASCYRTEGRTAGQIVDEAQAKVLALADDESRIKTSERAVGGLITEVLQLADHRSRHAGELLGMSTGYADLDAKTEGFQPGDLIIVAGRPSMGKTSFAMNVTESPALRGKAVLVFSMEMNGVQIAQRYLSSVSRVPLQKIRSGRLDQSEWGRIESANAKLHSAPLDIDDSAALSVSEVRARARRVHRLRGGLSAIVIDYIQLMKTAGGSDNRASELAEVSRGLKNLARELQCPVIALSQLNRSLEQRPNKRPVMSDLRESGAIEQDADLILFVYRDEVYHEDSPAKGTAEIIIGKQRNGPIGTVRLAFLNELTRFENYAGNIDFLPTRPQPVRRSHFEAA